MAFHQLRRRFHLRLRCHRPFFGVTPLFALFVAVVCCIAPADAQAASHWVLRDSGTTANLFAIAHPPSRPEQPVVVGEQGTILVSADSGLTWIRRSSGSTATLRAVGFFDFDGANRGVIAVGDEGTILVSPDGVTWTREVSPTNIRLNALTLGRVSGSVYAFGEAGAGWLERDPRGAWTRHDAPFADRAIRGALGGFLAAEGGLIYERHDDGPLSELPTWRAVATGVSSDLEAIASGAMTVSLQTSATPYVAVGANGTILQRTSDGRWVPRDAGTIVRLRGLGSKAGGDFSLGTLGNRVSLGEFFAIGDNGTLLRSANGSTWQRDMVPTAHTLNGIIETVVVGDAGTILTYDRTGAAPVIVRQPIAGHDETGRGYIEAEARGDGALSYVWVQLTAGAPFFVASGSPRLLPVHPVLPGFPVFQLFVGNAAGFTWTEPIAPHQLINLSTLAVAGGGEATLITGFSLGPDQSQRRSVLVRAVGPGLRSFGLNNPVAAPRLSIYAGSQLVATNTGWQNSANAEQIRAAAQNYGAFPLVENSADAAVLLDLTPGLYTAVVEAPAGVAPGPVLLEVYDAAAPRLTALQNLSTRTRVRAGETNAIGGLVVRGGLKKAVLIRIAGPALRTVGVQDVLPQPRAIVRRGAEVIVTVGPWSEAANAADIRNAAANVSAFAFAEGSADAAALVDLGPGAYTIEISGANATSGVALLEIYALPY